MEIVSPKVETYIEALFPSTDPVLKRMEDEGRRRRFPIVGPQVGRLLCQVAQMMQARKIFEMGSGFGYSALWFLKGMPEDGHLILTDDSPEKIDQARAYLEEAGFSDRVTLRTGDALEIMDDYAGPFDVIFNDVDKEAYPRAFARAFPRLRRGGALISDNTLWFGSVLGSSREPDVQGIREYNRLISETGDLFSSLIPIRDGLSISIKL